MSKYIKNIGCSVRLKSKQHGFTLIEIMVSALILSVGVLGVASLQIVGLKGTQQSYTKQQAMSVIQNLTERMRSNKQAVLDGHYEFTTGVEAYACGAVPADCSSAAASCSGQELAEVDIYNLVCGYQVGGGVRTGAIKNVGATDNSTFIGGDLMITCPGGDCSTGDVSMELNWTERAIDSREESVQDSLIVNTNISL